MTIYIIDDKFAYTDDVGTYWNWNLYILCTTPATVKREP